MNNNNNNTENKDNSADNNNFFDYDEYISANSKESEIVFPLPFVTKKEIELPLRQNSDVSEAIITQEEDEPSILASDLEEALGKKDKEQVPEQPVEVTQSPDPVVESTENEQPDTSNQSIDKEIKKKGRPTKKERRAQKKKIHEDIPDVNNKNEISGSNNLVESAESMINAFDLDEDETDDADDYNGLEAVNDNEKPDIPVAQRSLRRNLYFTIGIAVCIFSIVGIILSGSWLIRGIGNIINNTSQKEEFEALIYPIVMNDPPPAENVTQLPADTLLACSIWNIILYEDLDKYPTEFGNITVPQIDVDKHGARLFGSDIRLNHKTIGDPSLSFYYNASSQSYTIPTEPQHFTYAPMVETIHREGDLYTLRVGYISPHPSWMQVERDNNGNQLADKYMEYKMMRTSNGYLLVSIKEAYGGIGDGGVMLTESSSS